MNDTTQRAAARVYEGTWDILAGWFRVPKEPPTLPVEPGGLIETFGPSPDFLRYMKFWFWLGMLPTGVGIFIAWIATLVAAPLAGILLTPPAVFLTVALGVIFYVALHLRYDTTRYVITDRSLRVRRGIWVIKEVTITFENVQNVEVRQGPLQRHFGIADVIIETAGGGGGDAAQQGCLDTHRVREIIVGRLRESRHAGLGDDMSEHTETPGCWSPQHVTVLREIRGEIAAMRA